MYIFLMIILILFGIGIDISIEFLRISIMSIIHILEIMCFFAGCRNRIQCQTIV